MKITTLILTLLSCSVTYASTVTFTGVIDRINPGSPFEPGDIFIARFQYDQVTKTVNRATITVEERQFKYLADGTRVSYGTDPCDGSVYYQVVNSSYVSITMQAATPDCNIPDLSMFNLNNFVYIFNSFGHMTQIPHIVK